MKLHYIASLATWILGDLLRMSSSRTARRRSAKLRQLLQEASELYAQQQLEQLHEEQPDPLLGHEVVRPAPPSLIADEKYSTVISPSSTISLLCLVLLFASFKIAAALSDASYKKFVQTHTTTWMNDAPSVPKSTYMLEKFFKPLIKKVESVYAVACYHMQSYAIVCNRTRLYVVFLQSDAIR